MNGLQMLRVPWVLCVLGVLSDACSAHGQSPDEIKAGFVSLFNGKDFAGWRFGAGSALETLPKNWSVADGMIQVSGGGSPHLASQWDYEDFDFRLEWKAHKKGYNSGVYVRSGRNVNANQINLAEKDCGHLIYGVPGGPAVPKLQKPAGEWNEWRILAQGDKLTLWCNDEKAWELTGFKPARGYLGIQAEGAAIDFKNLRIKELGYTTLNDLKQWGTPVGWKQEGDAFFGNAESKPLVLSKAPADFTLRLEYLGDGVIQRGGKTLLAWGDTDIKKYVNPVPQGNYLEVAVKQGKAKVWINGNAIPGTRDAEASAGDLAIVPSGAIGLRNLRIREDK